MGMIIVLLVVVVASIAWLVSMARQEYAEQEKWEAKKAAALRRAQQEREKAASLAKTQKEYQSYANKCEKISQSISRLMDAPTLTSYLSSAKSIAERVSKLPATYNSSADALRKNLQAKVSDLYKETLVQYIRLSYERVLSEALEPMTPDQFRRRINAFFSSVDKHNDVLNGYVLGEVGLLRKQSRAG